MEILFIIVPLFIGVVASVIIGVIVFAVIKSVSEWADNNSKPIESLAAQVATKRTEVSGSGSSHGGMTSTYYYCTFELPDGERLEFRVKGREFGQLVEGDRGTLTFQGTRYHGFRRLIG